MRLCRYARCCRVMFCVPWCEELVSVFIYLNRFGRCWSCRVASCFNLLWCLQCIIRRSLIAMFLFCVFCSWPTSYNPWERVQCGRKKKEDYEQWTNMPLVWFQPWPSNPFSSFLPPPSFSFAQWSSPTSGGPCCPVSTFLFALSICFSIHFSLQTPT